MSDNIIHLNEAALKGELKNLVRNSVEKTLNELLNHEADRLVNAQRYERNTEPVKAIVSVATTGTLPPRPAMWPFMSPSSKGSHLKRPSSKGIAAEKPPLKRP